MEDQKLKEYFKFDETDLELNRKGQFSEKQIGILAGEAGEFSKDMRRTAIPFVLAAVLGPLSAILGRSMGWVWILIWGVGWTLLWGVIGWGFVEGSFTRSKFMLAQVKGRIKIAMKEGYSSKRRKTEIWSDLLVNRKRFEVETDLSNMMMRGDEYIIYYNKGTNRIVSLEFVSPAEKPLPDAERAGKVDFEAEARKLRKQFDFTEADLMANQSGALSEKQKERTAKEEMGGKALGLIIGAVLFLVGLAFGRLALDSMKTITQMPELWLKILWGSFSLIFVLFVLALIGGGAFLIVSQLIGKNQTKLLNIRGRANLIKGYGDRRSHVYYDLYINGHEFDGDGSMPKAIMQDAEYIVYYMEGAERIMSVELISVDE